MQVDDAPKTDGAVSLPCDYNSDNLKWSGKAILNSTTLPLWEIVKKDLGVDASGPKAFAAVVHKLQQVGSTAVCALVNELKNISLQKEPGQDVEIFGQDELLSYAVTSLELDRHWPTFLSSQPPRSWNAMCSLSSLSS
jgi:hypothetical protein